VLPGATATDLWAKAGRPVEHLPGEIVMSTGDMVDAALAGLDQGELITIPSLPDAADWQAYEAARQKLRPNCRTRLRRRVIAPAPRRKASGSDRQPLIGTSPRGLTQSARAADQSDRAFHLDGDQDVRTHQP
jgi:hypothetical protein